MGAIGTIAIGMIWFAEPATVIRGLLILWIIGSAIGLKFTSGHQARLRRPQSLIWAARSWHNSDSPDTSNGDDRC